MTHYPIFDTKPNTCQYQKPLLRLQTPSRSQAGGIVFVGWIRDGVIHENDWLEFQYLDMNMRKRINEIGFLRSKPKAPDVGLMVDDFLASE